MENEEDDFYSNPELKSESHGGNGKVAVWINVFFEEDNKLIGWYDHDFSEAGSIRTAQEIPTYSYGDSYGEAVLKELNKYTIAKLNYVFLLYDYVYEGKVGFLTDKEKHTKGVEASEGAVFLGNFDFNKN